MEDVLGRRWQIQLHQWRRIVSGDLCDRSCGRFRSPDGLTYGSFKERCQVKPATTPSDDDDDDDEEIPTSNKTFSALLQEAYTKCPIGDEDGREPFLLPGSPQSTPAYLGGRDVQAYLLPNSSTGVLYVQTFQPKGGKGPACTHRWIADASLAVKNLTQAGVQNLLIDTSNNPGGNPKLSQVLQQLLTGREFFLRNNMEILVRKSPLSEALVQGHIANPEVKLGPFRQDQFQWPNLTMLTTSDDYFHPGMARIVNNRTYYASNLVQDETPFLDNITTTFELSTAAPWPPGKIVFTGNGLCSSSCSQLTSYLIEFWNATGVINTPQPERPIQFHNILASVINDGDVYQEAAAVGLGNDTALLPPPRSVQGKFSFAVNANLSPRVSPGNFVEYTSYPAKSRFALTPRQYLDPMAQWQEAARIAFG